VELRTAIISGKRRTNLQDHQEHPRAGICEASKRDVQRAAEGEKPELMEESAPSEERKEKKSEVLERSTPSETEKETA
jgi:hypothetical protein